MSGNKTCRLCNKKNLFVAVDLGKMPIANKFLKSNKDVSELFDAKMLVCRDCGLGQISEDLLPAKLFEDYKYKSSVDKSLLEYSKKYVEKQIKDLNIKENDWVLELASNDGYLLKYFKDHKVNVLGVDPASNIAMYGICDGVPTVSEFFGSNLAKKILRIKGYPRLIIANNVLAHVPDIQDFMHGISILCNENTKVSIENPTIMNILLKDHFDTIYHEHYSYLSCNSVYRLANRFGLELYDIEQNNMQGGSNRYWLSSSENQKDSVKKMISEEINNGLFEEQSWNSFQKKLEGKVNTFNIKLKNMYDSGNIVCGYAASGKAVQILNYAKIDPQWIKSIADDLPEKQNIFFPGIKIPVLSLDDMLKHNPSHILIFSWNIYQELKNKILNITNRNIDILVWSDL
jgi:hypothetical protein